MEQPPAFAGLAEVVGRFLNRSAVSLVRASVIELAVTVEEQVDLALALHLAGTPRSAEVLLTDVLWRAPLDSRIDQLEQAMRDTGLEDRYPFVVPVSRKVIKARHVFAHSVAWGSPAGISVYNRRRGRRQEQLIPASYLVWLVRQGPRLRIELDYVTAQIGDVAVWGALYGFDDGAPDDPEDA